MHVPAYHGGAFFEGIGEDFSTLENTKKIVSADVLDAWFDPSPKVVKIIRDYLNFSIKTSPPTHAFGLRSAISKFRGIPIENILVGGGSSDLTFAFFPRLLEKKDKVLILDPMYGEYAHILEKVIGATVFRHRLHKEDNFSINMGALIGEIQRIQPKMVMVVNPNTPTGQLTARKEWLRLLNAISPKIQLVVDEAYIEYAGGNHSLEKDVKRYPNLVILKSMSKVYALSGVRVGYLVASTLIINRLLPYIPPWAVSLPGQMAGVTALRDTPYYRKQWVKTHRLRKSFSKKLARFPGFKVYDSVLNLLLVELPKGKSARKIIEKLREKNIYVRDCSSMGKHFGDSFLRITVKSAETNDRIVQALKNIL